MKAKIKATGEVIEINESSTIYDARMCHVYNASELENILDTDHDYWTRLEHQYAGMVLLGLSTRGAYGKEENIADYCYDTAHALVEKMKKEEE